MPEAPESYVMSQRFRHRFPPGHCLSKITALADRYKKGSDAIPAKFIKALPLKITDVTSKGKKTIVKFNKGWSLLASYGMSGHWEISQSDGGGLGNAKRSLRGESEGFTRTPSYAQLEFTFANPAGLKNKYYWVSSRSLPTCVVQFLTHPQLCSELDKLGLDIIRDDPDPEQVLEAYGNSRKNICAFIMEQNKFCGIGNYIKAVVLYRCGISPHCKVHELDDGQRWLIWETAKEVAEEAVAAKGMGMRDYKDENGKKVGVSFDITPYNMKKDYYGNKVTAEDIAGRTTWWVPAIQN